MEFIDIKKVSERIKVPDWVAVGLVRSGLLGYTNSSGEFSSEAIESYELYGTQWNEKLAPRNFNYSDLAKAEPEGWKNAPPDTFTELQISLDKNQFSDKDVAWIAQFYIRPNQFFFLDPQGSTTNSPQISLESKKWVSNSDFPNINIIIYPDPYKQLSLISVHGTKLDNDESPLEYAERVIQPLISELSYKYDQPLFISQKHWIGLPSGTISIYTQRRVEIKSAELSGFTDYHELRESKSLYLTALNQNEPMYKFLSFYRVIESLRPEVTRIRRDQRIQMKMPKHPAFGHHKSKNVGQVVDKLKAQFRNAIAHADRKSNSSIISLANPDEYHGMLLAMPTVRYIARLYIETVEEALTKTV